jgi:hypothetical protein
MLGHCVSGRCAFGYQVDSVLRVGGMPSRRFARNGETHRGAIGDQTQLGCQVVDDLFYQLMGLVAFGLEQTGGHSQTHRQERYQRKQGGVGQSRGPDHAPVPHKAAPHQYPEVQKPLERMQPVLVLRRHSPVVQHRQCLLAEPLEDRQKSTNHFPNHGGERIGARDPGKEQMGRPVEPPNPLFDCGTTAMGLSLAACHVVTCPSPQPAAGWATCWASC